MLGLLVAISIDARAMEGFDTVYSDKELPTEHQLEIFKGQLVTDSMIRRVIINEGTMHLQTLREHYDRLPLRIGYHKDVQALLEWELELVKAFDNSSGGSKSLEFELPQVPSDATISKILIPDWNSFLSVIDRARRGELAVETVIELRQYRAEHDEYPESWDMPIDPLSGKPMIYRRTDDGFEIMGSLADDDHPLVWRWK